MQDWLLSIWYGGPASGRWLQPLAWLYGGMLHLRHALYARGWRRRYRSNRPVVVVGNLSVGGTGKTPFVLWLAQQLTDRGLKVGIASRGYGGAGGPARRVAEDDGAALVGDEALLLQRRFGRPVAVGARRADAVRLLEADCGLILCDDGLQHEALARDFEIVVIDGTRGLGNGRLLPAGPLREPATRLASVDAVVVNGGGFERPGAIRMQIVPRGVIAIGGTVRHELSEFSGRPVIAVAAIGHPARFFALLREWGLEIEERPFSDHAVVTPEMAGVGQGRAVLMTEKDAVKCTGNGWQDAWYLTVDAEVEPASAALLLDRIATLPKGRQ